MLFTALSSLLRQQSQNLKNRVENNFYNISMLVIVMEFSYFAENDVIVLSSEFNFSSVIYVANRVNLTKNKTISTLTYVIPDLNNLSYA